MALSGQVVIAARPRAEHMPFNERACALPRSKMGPKDTMKCWQVVLVAC